MLRESRWMPGPFTWLSRPHQDLRPWSDSSQCGWDDYQYAASTFSSDQINFEPLWVQIGSSKTRSNWSPVRRPGLDIASELNDQMLSLTLIWLQERFFWNVAGGPKVWAGLQFKGWLVGCRVGAPIGHPASGLPPKKESISSVSTGSDLSFPPRASHPWYPAPWISALIKPSPLPRRGWSLENWGAGGREGHYRGYDNSRGIYRQVIVNPLLPI